jgi:hypothetical protein
MSMVDNSTLWHRRLGHANMMLVQNLASNELVRNLPKLSFERHYCDTCLGSQGQANHRNRNEVATNMVLELLHLNLYGPSPIQSYGGNFYTLMIVDDYSNYTWMLFLESNNKVLGKFDVSRKKLKNLLDCSIVSIKQIIVVNLKNCNLVAFVNNMEYLITYRARSLIT